MFHFPSDLKTVGHDSMAAENYPGRLVLTGQLCLDGPTFGAKMYTGQYRQSSAVESFHRALYTACVAMSLRPQVQVQRNGRTKEGVRKCLEF
jgi:hypothetical protein